MFKSLSFPVTESSQVGEARRAAHRLAEEAKLKESLAGALNIIISEAGTNLHKHAQGGELIIRSLASGVRRGVEVISLDRGPGVADLARCLEDGYSTTGTRGQGLGAIKRLSTVFDAYSTPRGTILVAQVWDKLPSDGERELEMGAVCLPYPGEVRCGDAWSKVASPDRWSVAVVDGLGHGNDAADAAEQALDVFEEVIDIPPQLALQRIHDALRSTRGAAVFLLEVDLRERRITSAGIGNISAGTVLGDVTKSFVSHNGTVGHQAQKFQEFVYDWPKSSVIVFHSDGLQTKWKLNAYPGLQVRHPSIIAATLYRDFRRTRDDVTVLVAKEGRET